MGYFWLGGISFQWCVDFLEECFAGEMKSVNHLRIKLGGFTVSGKAEALEMEVSAFGSHAVSGSSRVFPNKENTLSKPQFF